MDEHFASSVGMNRRLSAMRALGYRFGTSNDETGLAVALVGARVHHGVIDIVQFYGEHDADATRVSCTETDTLSPAVVFWCTSGASGQVVDALLGLADPERHPVGPERPRLDCTTFEA
jgi:hypothetical protein